MKKSIDGTKIVFTFDGLSPVEFDATKVGGELRAYAEMHGWQARIGDNAAISRKQKDGSVVAVTEQMRRDAIEEMVNYYETGATKWDSGRSGIVRENPTIRALATKLGGTYAQAEAYITEKMLGTI